MLGAILDLMQCVAEQDSEESQEPVVPCFPSHSLLHRVDFHKPHKECLSGVIRVEFMDVVER